MNEKIRFLQAFIKDPLTVGAIAPSSPDLARAMMAGVEADENNIVIELGCGTGAITRFIEKGIPDKKSFLGIELDKQLVNELNQQFPDSNIVCGSAADALAIHERSGLGKPRYILSGLPFVTLPAEVKKGILAEIGEFMADGCTFRTFQYAHGYYTPAAIKFRKFMSERYGPVKLSPLVIKNIPPAYTLTWTT